MTQANLENNFPIILEKNKEFKENYASMLRFLAINEMYIECIEDLENRKSLFKHEFKKQANISRNLALDVSSKFFKGKDLLNDYDSLHSEIIDNIKKELNRIEIL